MVATPNNLDFGSMTFFSDSAKKSLTGREQLNACEEGRKGVTRRRSGLSANVRQISAFINHFLVGRLVGSSSSKTAEIAF